MLGRGLVEITDVVAKHPVGRHELAEPGDRVLHPAHPAARHGSLGAIVVARDDLALEQLVEGVGVDAVLLVGIVPFM